jgi:hypothetical protein
MFSLIERDFVSLVCRYLGVGFISGSIVHAGTLGGDATIYCTLLLLGVLLFVLGTYLEEHAKNTVTFIVSTTGLSLGVGMMSGGMQHFFDGPLFASLIIPIGLSIG